MEPTDKLTPLALDWCKKVGSAATTVTELLNNNDDKVTEAIQEGIKRANARATSRAQNIQKWHILPIDFSIPGGELGELYYHLFSKLYNVKSVNHLIWNL